MTKLLAIVGIGICFIFGLFALSFAQGTESITITTYYPSPYGSYQELRATRMAVGTNYINRSVVCWDPLCPIGSVDLSGTNTDLVVEGNVGIGTTNPGARLHVESNFAGGGPTVVVKNAGGGDAAIDFRDTANDTRANVAYVTSSPPPRFVVNQGVGWGGSAVLDTTLNEGGGNVGIGTTGPSDKLHVADPAGAAGNYTGIRIQNRRLGGRAYGLAVTDSSHPWGGGKFSIYDWTAGSNRILIDSSGNVGIGTTATSGKLVVSDNEIAGNFLDDDSDGGVDEANGGMVMTTQGYVGIGTLPSMRLHLLGGVNNTNDAWFKVERVGAGPGATPGATYLGVDTEGHSALQIARPGRELRFYDSAGTYKFAIRDSDNNLYAFGIWQSLWSDKRLKRNITSLGNILDRVLKISPITFQWKKEAKLDNTMHYGVIAQEIREVFPSLVYEDEDGYLNVRRDELQFILIQAIKDLKAKNDTLETKNTQLESRIDALEAKLNFKSK